MTHQHHPDGRVTIDWPPTGPHATLWAHARNAYTDDQLRDLITILWNWCEEDSTLVRVVDGGVVVYDADGEVGA